MAAVAAPTASRNDPVKQNTISVASMSSMTEASARFPSAASGMFLARDLRLAHG
jgi:hypothetical protein